MGNVLDQALQYLPALSIGQKASEITGASNDTFVGMGYASLIQSLTGSAPTIQKTAEGKAKLFLTPSQNAIMKKWLDARVAAGIKIAKAPSNLDLNAGTYITPVIIKYAAPTAIIVFILGYIAASMLGKR